MAHTATGRKVGRNDPCPCGSGRKYKLCCERKRGVASYAGWFALVVVLVIGATIFALSLTRGEAERLRQVWSPEHGHYHTIP